MKQVLRTPCLYLCAAWAIIGLTGCGDQPDGDEGQLIVVDAPIGEELGSSESDAIGTPTPTTNSESEQLEPEMDMESMAAPECPPANEATPMVRPDRRTLELYREDDNLYAWRKTRGSLDPNEDVVFYWSGYIYDFRTKDPERYRSGGQVDFADPIFGFEGFNVGRIAQRADGTFLMVTREVSVYTDPWSGRILDCWQNTLRPDAPRVRVLHVTNDPVNFGVGSVSHVELGDRISFYSDILLSYRSPLAGDERYSDYSAGDVYQSNELFNFMVNRADLEDESQRSVPVEISWTRVGQYLPWMQMGETQGNLIYHVRGFKLPNGIDSLPERLRRWTVDTAGESYLRSPENVPLNYTPNATTWRVFRSALDNGAYADTCD